MSQTGARLLVLVLIFSFGFSYALEASPYMWGFDTIPQGSTSIPTCEDLVIDIVGGIDASGAPRPSTGAPPYSMLAYAVGGSPRVYGIGPRSDGRLVWRSDYPVGTTLVLQVVDSRQRSGGFGPIFYTTVAGASSSCIQQDLPPIFNDTNAFTISANVTKPSLLGTCDRWSVTVLGGTPPFTFTLFAFFSPSFPNVLNTSTVAHSDDTVVWVNRADPGRVLMVSASDSTGRHAFGLPLVHTEGSSDTRCPDADSQPKFLNSHSLNPSPPLISLSSTATVPSTTPSNSSTSQASLHQPKTKLIVMIAVPVSLGALGLLFVLCYLCLRSKRTPGRGSGFWSKNILHRSRPQEKVTIIGLRDSVLYNSYPGVVDLELGEAQGHHPPRAPNLYGRRSSGLSNEPSGLYTRTRSTIDSENDRNAISSTAQYRASRETDTTLVGSPTRALYYLTDVHRAPRPSFSPIIPIQGRKRSLSETNAIPRTTTSPPPSYSPASCLYIHLGSTRSNHRHTASLPQLDTQRIRNHTPSIHSHPLSPIPKKPDKNSGQLGSPSTYLELPVSSCTITLTQSGILYSPGGSITSRQRNGEISRSSTRDETLLAKGKGRSLLDTTPEVVEPVSEGSHVLAELPTQESDAGASGSEIHDPRDPPPRYQSPSFRSEISRSLSTSTNELPR